MLVTINRRIRINAIGEAYEKHIEGTYVIDNKYNNFSRFVYIIEGRAIVKTDGEEFPIQKGETFVFQSDEKVVIVTEDGSKVKILSAMFQMTGTDIQKIYGKVIMVNARGINKLNKLITSLRDGGGTENDYLEGDGLYFLHEVANDMEIYLMTLLDSADETYTVNSRAANEFKEIVEVMRTYIFEPLSVKDIAEKCGMSESNLKKIFSRYSICSVHKYFLKMKVFKAIELLNDNYNVAEISERLCFNNQNYFGVVFKKETGYSPLNYRKKYLRNL
ncbi:MAG: AraC family transcriptional regulator [Bacillota bacterium]|nr:AraC family transcriptional regulator [Bacillota bacterium]